MIWVFENNAQDWIGDVIRKHDYTPILAGEENRADEAWDIFFALKETDWRPVWCRAGEEYSIAARPLWCLDHVLFWDVPPYDSLPELRAAFLSSLPVLGETLRTEEAALAIAATAAKIMGYEYPPGKDALKTRGWLNTIFDVEDKGLWGLSLASWISEAAPQAPLPVGDGGCGPYSRAAFTADLLAALGHKVAVNSFQEGSVTLFLDDGTDRKVFFTDHRVTVRRDNKSYIWSEGRIC